MRDNKKTRRDSCVVIIKNAIVSGISLQNRDYKTTYFTVF